MWARRAHHRAPLAALVCDGQCDAPSSTCAGSSDADRSIDYHMSASAQVAICSSVWRGPPRAANMGPNAHTHTHSATTKIPSAVLQNLSPSTRHKRKQQQQTCMHDHAEITHLCGRPHDHRSRRACEIRPSARRRWFTSCARTTPTWDLVWGGAPMRGAHQQPKVIPVSSSLLLASKVVEVGDTMNVFAVSGLAKRRLGRATPHVLHVMQAQWTMT